MAAAELGLVGGFSGSGVPERIRSSHGGAEMKHATSRMLFSYWDELRGERSAPERRDVEPGAIRHVLADTFILANQIPHPPVIRLAGTRCSALFGRDLRGLALGELWPVGRRSELTEQLDLVLNDAFGFVAGLHGRAENGWHIDLELMLLPLRHHGRTDARALGSLSPVTLPSWVGLIPIVALETSTSRIIDPVRLDMHAEAKRDNAVERRARFVIHQGGRASPTHGLHAI